MSKQNLFIAFLTIIVCLPSNLSASNDNFGSSYEDLVKEGSIKLNALIKQNAENDRLGCPEDNQYILFLTGYSEWMSMTPPSTDLESFNKNLDGQTIYNEADLERLSLDLLVFNSERPNGVELYVCLITNWKVPLYAPISFDVYSSSNAIINYLKNSEEALPGEEEEVKNKLQKRHHDLVKDILLSSNDTPFATPYTAGNVNKALISIATFQTNRTSAQLKYGHNISFAYDPNSTYLKSKKEDLKRYIGFKLSQEPLVTTNANRHLIARVDGFIEYVSDEPVEGFVENQYALNCPDLDGNQHVPNYILRDEFGEVDYAADAAEAITQLAQDVNQAYTQAQANSGTYNYSSSDPNYIYIVNNENAQLDGMIQIEHKLAYLQEVTGVYFFLAFLPVDFQMENRHWNTFASAVFSQAQLGNNCILLTLPFNKISAEDPDLHAYCGHINPGLHINPENLLEEPFLEGGISQETITDLYKLFGVIYSNLEKPYKAFAAFLPVDESDFIAKPIEQQETGFIRDKPAINELFLYYDKDNRKRISDYNRDYRNCALGPNYDGAITINDMACNVYYLEMIEQAREAAKDLPFSDYKPLEYESIIIEKYIPEYYAKYALLEYRKQLDANLIPDKWEQLSWLQNDANFIDPQYFYSHDLIEYVYDGIDAAGLALAPFGLDFLTDGITVIVGAVDLATGDDPQRGLVNMSFGAVGIFLPGTSESYQQLARNGDVLVFRMKDALFKSLSDLNSADEVEILFRLNNRPDIASNLLSISSPNGGSLYQRLATKPALVRRITQDLLPNQRETLLQKLTDNPDLVEAFVEAPTKSFDNWQVIYNNANLYDKVFGTVSNLSSSARKDLFTDLSSIYPSLTNTFLQKPNWVDAWDVLNRIDDESIKSLRIDTDMLERLSNDLIDNPGLDIFINNNGQTGFLAWKFADDAFPGHNWCN